MKPRHVSHLIPILLLIAALADSPSAWAAVGRVVAWGDNTFGQTNVPPGLTNVVAVASGDYHNLALQRDGSVVAWGYNIVGQTNVPAELSNVVAIAAGTYHSVALKQDGTVATWGYVQAVVPPGLSNVVAIAAGHHQTFALKSDGTVLQWPSYSGPVPSDLSNVVAIAAGGNSDVDHAVALQSNGRIRTWGDDYFGQNDFPPGLNNVLAIAAGSLSGFALTNDGTVVQWGQANPMPSGLNNIVAVASEVALKADGTVVPWIADSVAAGLSNVVAVSRTLALVGNGPPTRLAALTNPHRGPGGFSVWLLTNNGRVYALEYKDSLSDNTWTALPLVAGTGGMLLLTDNTAPTSQRFYRVQQW